MSKKAQKHDFWNFWKLLKALYVSYTFINAGSFQKYHSTSNKTIWSVKSFCGNKVQGFYTSGKKSFNSTFWHFSIFRDFWKLYDGAAPWWGVRGCQKFLWGIFGCCALIPEKKIFGRHVFYEVIFSSLDIKKTRFLATNFEKSE